jgi:hypothetical protein
VYYFLDAVPQSTHGGILTGAAFDVLEIGGVLLKDWLIGAVDDPGAIVDRVEEGTLVTAFPGVLPFACQVDP